MNNHFKPNFYEFSERGKAPSHPCAEGSPPPLRRLHSSSNISNEELILPLKCYIYATEI